MLKERIENYRKDLDFIQKELLITKNYEDIDIIVNYFNVWQSLSRIVDTVADSALTQQEVLDKNKNILVFLNEIAVNIFAIKDKELDSYTVTPKKYMNLLGLDTTLSILIDKYQQMVDNAEKTISEDTKGE